MRVPLRAAETGQVRSSSAVLRMCWGGSLRKGYSIPVKGKNFGAAFSFMASVVLVAAPLSGDFSFFS